MSELISRQNLIEELEKNSIFRKVTNAEGKNVIEIIESQPPADNWIPCSLAVPKPFNNVLVSYCDYSIGFMHLQYDNKWHDDDWLVAEPEEIIAWMPLPEPYKGE